VIAYAGRRILISVLVLLVASVLVFVFVRATTDPTAHLRLSRDPTAIQRERTRLGLDEPLPVQYGNWLKDFVRGDWGESYRTRRSVSTEIRSKLWVTTQVAFFGVVLSLAVAVAVGVYSAVRRYSTLDHVFTGLSFAGLAIPIFWLALLLIQFLSYDLQKWLGWDQPLFYSVGLSEPTGGVPFGYLRHMALPVICLSVQLIAGWSRYQRASMLEAMSSDYLRTARAKGVPRHKVVFKHALRNASIPLVNVTAVDVGALFGGLIVTETVFSLPGMGRLLVDSLLNGDTAVLLAWLMVTAAFIVAFNLIADLLVGVLDPRVRLS